MITQSETMPLSFGMYGHLKDPVITTKLIQLVKDQQHIILS